MKKKDNNRTLKLIALLIAVVLWFYVGVEQDPLSHRTYDVPLETQNLAVDKSAALGQETVSIRVTGRQDRLNDISASDFSAYVDLSDVRNGESQVRVEVDLPSGVYFAHVDPETVTVLITDRQGQNMDVEVVTEGEAPEGISVDEISVAPEQVFVTGDPGEIASVDHAGVLVDLSTISEDSDTDMAVTFFDEDNNEITGAQLEALPQVVTVSIKVSEGTDSKAVPVQANLVGSLPDGYQLVSVNVSPSSVTLSGSAETLAEVSTVSTAAIDLSEITGTTTETVAIDSTLAADPQSVSVTIEVIASESGVQTGARMLPLVVSGQGAASVSVDTQMVEVTYHMLPGYEDAGDSLSVFINVGSVPQSVTTAAVQVNNVEGLVIDSISPSTVTLTPLAGDTGGSEGSAASGY